MLWHRDKSGASVAKVQEPQKAKKLGPKEQMAEQLDLLEPGKEITYKLGAIYVKPFITVVRNEKGKKFTVLQDGADAAGAPAGTRNKLWDVNHAKDVASWVIDRGGGFYSG
jgi:hypothetical protein